ncbi:hypothetical protein PoB_001276000 [Plakobranchus ocellatus]|uniref:Uncharacterized protein n=1 Tax=Plakobranchus ocellatus TaxID=259542 RepID=A0AAV3YSZ2_9GAST|nr:hypothetical protein PoB_001276000 [Plakobranchus ocellatus]
MKVTVNANPVLSAVCILHGSSGKAAGYQVRGQRFESQSGLSQFFIVPLWQPSTKWVARSAKVKAARKAMANYLIMPYAKNNQNPTPGSPMLGLRVRPTLLC